MLCLYARETRIDMIHVCTAIAELAHPTTFYVHYVITKVTLTLLDQCTCKSASISRYYISIYPCWNTVV